MTKDAKEKILASAYKLFASEGYDATSINMIVASAGITKGALYHHYETKEDLFFAVIQYAMMQHGVPKLPVLESFTKKTLQQFIISMGLTFIDIHTTDHNFNNLFIELHMQARKNRRIGEWIANMKAQKLEFIEAVVTRGISVGAFQSKDAHMLAIRIFFLAESIGIHMSATGTMTCTGERIDFVKLWKVSIEEMFA